MNTSNIPSLAQGFIDAVKNLTQQQIADVLKQFSEHLYHDRPTYTAPSCFC